MTKLILLAAATICSATAQQAQEAPKPLYRDPVHDGAADPALIWNSAAKKWLMFYTNRRADLTGLPGVTWVHGTRIGIAESSDGGTHWKYAGTADLPYGKEDYTHWAPDVFEWKGIYHMYLSIVPGTFPDWNAAREIVHLTSPDLHKWKVESKLDLGSDRVIDATVMPLPQGGFRMWYKNERAKDGSIYYADSPDLYQWTSKGVALPHSRGEGPMVFRWKGRYWMAVDVWDGIGIYSSVDCLNWTRQNENILKDPGTKPTDRGKGQHVDVVVSGERAYIFYFVHQGGPDREGHPPEWQHRTFLQVAELGYRDGQITCNRDEPAQMLLTPDAGRLGP
jgi:hypothetical protein